MRNVIQILLFSLFLCPLYFSGCFVDNEGLRFIEGSIYEGESPHIIKKLRLDIKSPFSLSFVTVSADRKDCIYGDWNSDRLTVLRLEDGEVIDEIQTAQNQSASFSPEKNSIISGGKDGVLYQYSVDSKEMVSFEKGHEDYIRCVAYSPVDEKALSGGDDRKILLWDLDKHEIIKSFFGHTSGIRNNGLIWSSDGTHFLSGSWDGSIRYWDVKSGKEVMHVNPGYGRIMGLALSPCNRFVLSSHLNGQNQPVILWDLESGSELRRYGIRRSKYKVAWRLHAVSVAFSPDGKSALFGMDYGAVIWWDLDAWKFNRIYRLFREELEYVTFLDDVSAVAAGADADGPGAVTELRFFRLEKADRASEMKDPAAASAL